MLAARPRPLDACPAQLARSAGALLPCYHLGNRIWSMHAGSVLCSTVLGCSDLYCTVLCCPFHTILNHILPYCVNVPYRTIFAPHLPHCIIPYLHHTIRYHTEPCRTVLYLLVSDYVFLLLTSPLLGFLFVLEGTSHATGIHCQSCCGPLLYGCAVLCSRTEPNLVPSAVLLGASCNEGLPSCVLLRKYHRGESKGTMVAATVQMSP